MLALSTIGRSNFVGQRIVLGTSIEGWLSLIVSVWWLGGLTMFGIGVVGITCDILRRNERSSVYRQSQCIPPRTLDCFRSVLAGRTHFVSGAMFTSPITLLGSTASDNRIRTLSSLLNQILALPGRSNG